MAITKIIGATHPVSKSTYRTLKNTIEYIKNAAKTDNERNVGSHNCSVENAFADFVKTQKFYGKVPTKRSDRTGYHICISWSSEENVNEIQALYVLQEFCKKYLDGYEAIYSVHNDKGHMHGHICFNSVSYMSGYKYRYNNKDWEKTIQPIVDEICNSIGLNILKDDTGLELDEYDQFRINKKPTSDIVTEVDSKSHTNNKYYNEKNEKYSISDYLRDDMDYYMEKANSYDEFISELIDAGYQVKRGKSEKYGTYTAVKYEGMNRYKRLYSLGKKYTDKSIKNYISAKCEQMFVGNVKYRYIVPKRFIKVNIQYYSSNNILKKKYYNLFNLGIKSKTEHRMNYKMLKETLKEIEKIQYQIDVIIESENIEGFEERIKECEIQIKKINKEIYKNRNRIKDNLEKLKMYNDYKNMDQNDQRYTKVQRIIEMYNKSEEEICLEITNLKENNNNLYKEKKEFKNKEAAINEIIDEYETIQKNNQEYELDEEQLEMLDKNIENTYIKGNKKY